MFILYYITMYILVTYTLRHLEEKHKSLTTGSRVLVRRRHLNWPRSVIVICNFM